MKLAGKRMRMLRLGEGWSAEKLSDEYAKGGPGALTRTTIAKIEGGNRQIRASELERVARIFGLTSADLLGTDQPQVFLSYADRDSGTGEKISAWLGEYGFQVLPGHPPADDDQEAGQTVADIMAAVHAFIVVLTPDYLSSPSCRAELDLAKEHSQQLISAGQPAGFIHALRIAGTPDLLDDSFSSAAIDLPEVGSRSADVVLSKLGAGIISGIRASAGEAGPPVQDRDGEGSLSRSAELERVLSGLRALSGGHFWLVVGPPRIGKSWLLEQLETRSAEPAAGSWVTTKVDLRAGAGPGTGVAGGWDDAIKILSQMFGMDQGAATAEDYRVKIAQAIINSGQPRLCLLDSAELLPAQAVADLREHFGKIYQLAQARNARVAFVVASRNDAGWRGLSPAPRPSVLPLAGLPSSAVLEALGRLAEKTPGGHSQTELLADTDLLHLVTEGMPELVIDCLQWIQQQQWLEISRLGNQQFFDQIIVPFIEQRLLGEDSLLAGEVGQRADETKAKTALTKSLRALVTYRFFTPAHVSHHLKIDTPFCEAVNQAGWQEIGDLWQAIGEMALVNRPLVEPWEELHPAVRRLLYRYFYTSGERARAHALARDFTKSWADQLTGKDHVVGMMEAIWHETARLRESGEEMEEKLPSFARGLSLKIRPSLSATGDLTSYTPGDLRDYAVQRMADDHEFQRELASVAGLPERLTVAIGSPEDAED